MQLQICNQRKFKDAILFSKHHSSAFYCPVDVNTRLPRCTGPVVRQCTGRVYGLYRVCTLEQDQWTASSAGDQAAVAWTPCALVTSVPGPCCHHPDHREHYSVTFVMGVVTVTQRGSPVLCIYCL